VPTIIAIGLISVADRQKFAFITLVCSFAILFGSALYVASLSYKIFRNAAFIQALMDVHKNGTCLTWESALRLFNKEVEAPRILGSETKTISAIYATFSATYVLMFYEISVYFSFLFGVVLFAIAVRIWFIPRKHASYYDAWKKVLNKNIGEKEPSA
jgi:hypothetical protein